MNYCTYAYEKNEIKNSSKTGFNYKVIYGIIVPSTSLSKRIEKIVSMKNELCCNIDEFLL